MRIDFIADTNILLLILNGNDAIEAFLDFNFGISFVTEVELLGFKNLPETDEVLIKNLISDCHLLSWNSKIKNHTIFLRKNYNIKLPDAIIAATALAYKIPLISADKGFEKIKELDFYLVEYW